MTTTDTATSPYPEAGPVEVANSTVDLTLTALSPVHHGGGTAGNTAILRLGEVVNPHTGQQTAIPFISGNSLRHAIRDALAWHLARVLRIEAGGLSKLVVDLLWSGGALTTTGNQIDLARARQLGQVPPLALLGYSAQSDIVSGPLRVSLLNLVCAENGWRLPAHLRDHPHAALPAGRFRGEEFGTRHDITGSAPSLLVETGMLDTAPTTTQMIYDHEVLLPGSVLYGRVALDAATPIAADALAAALHLLAPAGEMWLAAQRGRGYGQCRLQLADRASTAPALLSPLPDPAEALDRLETHLRARRDRILAALSEATR